MVENERILPCIDCPELEHRIFQRELYDKLSNAADREDEYEILLKAGYSALAMLKIKDFEKAAKEFGCDGPSTSEIEGSRADIFCPVRIKMIETNYPDWALRILDDQ